MTAHRLLIYAPSYRRIEHQFNRWSDLEIVLMSEQGEMRLNDQIISADDVHPTIGWANFDIFGTPNAREFMRTLLKSNRLRWVQTASAGVDHPVFARLAAKGCVLTNTNSPAPAIAEYVCAAVLDHYQKADERRRVQAEKRWQQIPFLEIAGTTWLIVGYGSIGRETARRAKAFGARVIGVRRQAAEDEYAELVCRNDQIREHLPHADVVVLCCALTAQTKEIANAAFFAAMKPRSLFINVGRGGLVDEVALLQALERGTPERAVLDVFATEPLPADSPFWHHPRVRLTAHAAGVTHGTVLRSDAVFIANLQRYLSGAPLEHIVDMRDLTVPTGVGG